MTKSTLIGAAIVFSAALTWPAMAQHTAAHPSLYVLQSGICPGHEAGNPYTKDEDYIAWSGWRSRGGWDDRNDLNCLHPSRLRYPAAGF
jgi:hypothetical protein